MTEKKVDEDKEIWVHFPPVPTDAPGIWRAIGPPRARRITDQQIDHLPIDALAQLILDANDSNAIFGFENSDAFTNATLHRRFRRLALRLHPDKTTNEKAREAFTIVEEAHESFIQLLVARQKPRQ
jgi:hypothetical protein